MMYNIRNTKNTKVVVPTVSKAPMKISYANTVATSSSNVQDAIIKCNVITHNPFGVYGYKIIESTSRGSTAHSLSDQDKINCEKFKTLFHAVYTPVREGMTLTTNTVFDRVDYEAIKNTALNLFQHAGVTLRPHIINDLYDVSNLRRHMDNGDCKLVKVSHKVSGMSWASPIDGSKQFMTALEIITWMRDLRVIKLNATCRMCEKLYVLFSYIYLYSGGLVRNVSIANYTFAGTYETLFATRKDESITPICAIEFGKKLNHIYKLSLTHSHPRDISNASYINDVLIVRHFVIGLFMKAAQIGKIEKSKITLTIIDGHVSVLIDQSSADKYLSTIINHLLNYTDVTTCTIREIALEKRFRNNRLSTNIVYPLLHMSDIKFNLPTAITLRHRRMHFKLDGSTSETGLFTSISLYVKDEDTSHEVSPSEYIGALLKKLKDWVNKVKENQLLKSDRFVNMLFDHTLCVGK